MRTRTCTCNRVCLGGSSSCLVLGKTEAVADWIVPHGSNLTEAIRTELLQTGAAPGSGTIHAEIHTKKMLGYSETTKAVSTPLFTQWTEYVAAGSLAGAEALISSGTEWGNLMTRAVTFADLSWTRCDLGVRHRFLRNLTSPLLVRGPHYTHVY